MKQYWLELLLLAYSITCLDVMVTAWGIFNDIGSEANPLVTSIVPSSQPVTQIIFMAATSAFCFWFVFIGWKYINDYFTRFMEHYAFMVAWGSVFACATHIFGISTWLV
jgi:hypothetical protein